MSKPNRNPKHDKTSNRHAGRGNKHTIKKLKKAIRSDAILLLESAEEIAHLGVHLWDEIAKGIALKMPEQLIPVVNAIFSKHYPTDAKITFLSTEYATRKPQPGHPYPLILSDITFRIGDGDIYHLEFQIEKDGSISLRMLEYDFQIGMQHAVSVPQDSTVPKVSTATQDSTTLRNFSPIRVTFPHSAVIYPTGGNALPQFLDCIIQFQDGTEHTYRVPVVRISDYDLETLFQKHLNMFLPFSLLRFHNRLEYLHRLETELEKQSAPSFPAEDTAPQTPQPTQAEDVASQTPQPTQAEDIAPQTPQPTQAEAATPKTPQPFPATDKLSARIFRAEESLKKDLTGYIEELIMGLETEYKQGILTKWQYEEYLRLVHIALNHMLHDHPTLRKEATRMTECKLKFISDIIQEYEDDIAAKDAIITEKDAAITEKDATIAEKDAEIAALKLQLTGK